MLLKRLAWLAILNLSQVFVYCKDISRVKRSHDDIIPCEKGWFYFREKCYKLAGLTRSEAVSWDRANELCKSSGGSLVMIESEEENDFLTSYMILNIKRSAWIGLNDQSTDSEYVWSDGTPLGYENWKPTEPSGVDGAKREEDCVEIIFDPEHDAIGKWNDAECSTNRPYICEAPISEIKKSPNPKLCSVEEGEGYKFQNSCFHVVTELKSWDKAEQHCNDVFGGHLVTIVDMIVDIFLTDILSDIKKDMWIGIKIQDQAQQQWTSGWFVSYDGLNKSHGNFVEGQCVVRKKRKEWIMDSCARKHSFICEKSKDHPLALKPAVEGSYCPKEPYGWRDLHGEFCYFIELVNMRTWNEANFDCLRRGGHLLSLHSQVESDMLFQFIKYAKNFRVFTGLYRLKKEGEHFAWSDGSAMDFINWPPDEPNGFDERCGEVRISDMKWNDGNCADKRGYICSVKKIQPNTTAVVETISSIESISYRAMIGVSIIACIQTVILVGIAIYYFKSPNIRRREKPAAVLPPLPPFTFSPVTSPRYTTRELNGKDEGHYEIMRECK